MVQFSSNLQVAKCRDKNSSFSPQSALKICDSKTFKAEKRAAVSSTKATPNFSELEFVYYEKKAEPSELKVRQRVVLDTGC